MADLFHQIKDGIPYLFDFSKGPNISDKSTMRCRKNILSKIPPSLVPELQELIRFSSSNSFLDFSVFWIVSSWLHSDNWTWVCRHRNTSSIFTLIIKALNKTLPKGSFFIVTVTSFLFDTLMLTFFIFWLFEKIYLNLWHSLQWTDPVFFSQSPLRLVIIDKTI